MADTLHPMDPDPWGALALREAAGSLREYARENPESVFEIILNRLQHLTYLYLNNPYGIKDIGSTLLGGIPISRYLSEEIRLLGRVAGKVYGSGHDQPASPSETLVQVHGYLKNAVPSGEGQVYRVDAGRFAEDGGPAGKYLAKIADRAQDLLSESDAGLMLICSMATGDYKWEWSDIDSILFLADGDYTAPNLERLQRSLLKLGGIYKLVDPLQDHGIFVVLPIQRRYYSESILPRAVLARGAWIKPPSRPVDLALRTVKWMDCNALISSILPDLRTFAAKPDWSPLQVRGLLHRVFLFPTLVLQMDGIRVYKKESFRLLEERFPAIDWSFLRNACEVYHGWRLKRRYRPLLRAKILEQFPFLSALALKVVYGFSGHTPAGSIDARYLASKSLEALETILEEHARVEA